MANLHPMEAQMPVSAKPRPISLRRLLSPIGLLALAPLLTSCQPSDETTSDKTPAETAAPIAPAVPGSADSQAPPQPAAPESTPSAPRQATIDENKRIMAENQRLLAQIAHYGATDPAKLERVQAQCEHRLGKPADADLERQVIRCVINAW